MALRVLFVANYKPGVGGISGQVEILQNKLQDEGITADIFQTKGSVLYRLSLMRRLSAVAAGYDVIHVHCCSGWGFLPALIGVSVGRRLGRRVVVTYHGGGAERFFSKRKKLVRYFLTRTDQNVVLSGFVGEVLRKNDLPYTIIPNIIDLDGTRFRKRLPLEPHFICTRTLDPLYNHACILRAFAAVKPQLPDATLTLVGGGTIRDELEQMTKDMKLEDVHFIGRVSNDEIYEYLDEADIMLSAPHIDNMPVSVIEGINAGLLVISSNVGGVPYMVKDGESGLLFADDDDKELAAKMLFAVKQQPVWMIEAARQTLNTYSWNYVRPLLMQVYKG